MKLDRHKKTSVTDSGLAAQARLLLESMRYQQWLKNLLIFLPAIARHCSDPSVWLTLIVTFIAFSLCASSIYLLNDIVDRHNDKKNPHKAMRPITSGRLGIAAATKASILLQLVACLLAITLGLKVFLIFIFYVVLTVSYTFFFKKITALDIVILACLYVLRVVLGGIAVAIPLSAWLIAFCLFLFFSLAAIKRIAEAASATDTAE